MVHESTTKVGSVIVALALLGMVGLSVASPAQAEEPASVGEDNEAGPCIKVYTTPPAVGISPENCKPSGNLTVPA